MAEWSLLGEQTLSGTADVLEVAGFDAKSYLYVQASLIQSSSTIDTNLTVNSDTSSNYSFRYSLNGTSSTGTVENTTSFATGGDPTSSFLTFNISNIDGKEKLIMLNKVDGGTASGASNAPERTQRFGKWITTSGQITTITLTNAGAGTYASSSNLTIFGTD